MPAYTGAAISFTDLRIPGCNVAIDQPPDSKVPEKEALPLDCESRLKIWLDSLPPGGKFSVLLPGDEGYEETKAEADEEMARMFGPKDG